MNEAPQVVDRFSERSEENRVDRRAWAGERIGRSRAGGKGSGLGSRASARQGINC